MFARHPHMRRSKSFTSVNDSAAYALLGTAAVAAAAYVATALAVRARKMRDGDRKAQADIRAATNEEVKAASHAAGHLAKWYVHMPFAAVTSTKLLVGKRSVAGAAAVASASALSALANVLLENVSPSRMRPNGDDMKSFPSGHALQSSAVAITSTWVLVREGLARPWVVAPFALASLATTYSRMALDRHWVSDIAAGYCAGIAVGGACAGAYELTRK